MPDMSGFELLARLQQANFDGPVILASARADEAMKQAAQRAGAHCLFAKPVPSGSFLSHADPTFSLTRKTAAPLNKLQQDRYAAFIERPYYG